MLIPGRTSQGVFVEAVADLSVAASCPTVALVLTLTGVRLLTLFFQLDGWLWHSIVHFWDGNIGAGPPRAGRVGQARDEVLSHHVSLVVTTVLRLFADGFTFW